MKRCQYFISRLRLVPNFESSSRWKYVTRCIQETPRDDWMVPKRVVINTFEHLCSLYNRNV